MLGWWETSTGAVVAAALPWVAFVVWSNHQAGEHAAWVARNGERFAPLNKRWRGYTADDAAEYWGYLKARDGLGVETRYLHRDLAFPVVYGGAIALAIVFFAWRLDARGVLGWLALPIGAMVADWTENTAQLAQIARALPEPRAIARASLATRIKLGAVVASFVALASLCARTLCAIWSAAAA